MKRVAFSLVLLCLASSAIPAEAWGGFGYVMAGILASDPFFEGGNANEVLSDHGYERLSPYDFMFGGGGGALLDNWFFGGWGGGTIFPQSVQDTASDTVLTATYGWGGMEGGYYIGMGPVGIVPTLSLMWGGYSFTMIRQPGLVSFEELLDDPRYGVTVETSEFSLGVGATVLFSRGIWGIIGKAMYYYTPVRSWSISGGPSYSYPLSEVPDLGDHKVFLGVGFVWGGWTTDGRGPSQELGNQEED